MKLLDGAKAALYGIFLNYYCSKITQQMIRQGKESIMVEKALFTESDKQGVYLQKEGREACQSGN